jgi:LCP family protein required for cell wall assembly
MSEPRPRSDRTATISGIARHGRLKKSRAWKPVLALIGTALAVVLIAGASVGSIAVYRLTSTVSGNTFKIAGQKKDAPPPTIGAYPGGFNILIVGDDTRVGQDGIGAGPDDGGALNDVTILLHVSGNHENATAISIPRDMVVPIPSCTNAKGGHNSAMAGQPINVTLSYGGINCTILTVEKLTGLTIQFSGLITFTGVINMSDAVGGVPVCVSGPIHDKYTGLSLPSAGTYNLSGADALAFLRSRHGVGDGSDLGRISSQQVYLSALVRKLESSNTLANLPQLYSLASAATQSMQLSSSLDHLDTMIAIAQALKNIPLSSVQFVQYPGTTGVGGIYAGKVAPVQSQADALIALIKADKPFTLAPPSATDRGSVVDPNAPAPTTTPTASPSSGVPVLDGVVGQSAAEYTCTKPYSSK